MSSQNRYNGFYSSISVPTIISSTPTHSNARGVLCESLRPIVIGAGGIASTKPRGIMPIFDGALIPWTTFTSDVSAFFNSPEFQRALERCVEIPVAPNTESLHQLNPIMLMDFIEVHTDEIMCRRFSARVFESVKAVVATLKSSQFGHGEQLTEVPLPGGLSHRNVDQGQYGLYTLLVEEGSGKNLAVGMMLAANEYKMTVYSSGEVSFKQHAALEVFGTLFEAMKLHGVKYGFLTTYLQTIFVAADFHSDPSKCTLRYTDIVNRSTEIVQSGHGAALAEVSVRLGLTFLLHKAARF